MERFRWRSWPQQHRQLAHIVKEAVRRFMILERERKEISLYEIIK